MAICLSCGSWRKDEYIQEEGKVGLTKIVHIEDADFCSQCNEPASACQVFDIAKDIQLIKEALCNLLYNSEEDADMDKDEILKKMGYIPGTAHYYGENDPPEYEEDDGSME